jgi:hypothetical protein
MNTIHENLMFLVAEQKLAVSKGGMWHKTSSIHVDRIAAIRLKLTPLVNNDEKKDVVLGNTDTKRSMQNNQT